MHACVRVCERNIDDEKVMGDRGLFLPSFSVFPNFPSKFSDAIGPISLQLTFYRGFCPPRFDGIISFLDCFLSKANQNGSCVHWASITREISKNLLDHTKITTLALIVSLKHKNPRNYFRDYNDALLDRKWDTAVRAGDTLVLESIKTLLNGKVSNGRIPLPTKCSR